jgi:hypothetical protein
MTLLVWMYAFIVTFSLLFDEFRRRSSACRDFVAGESSGEVDVEGVGGA